MNEDIKCSFCQKTDPIWVYMPSGKYACDDCVPRKCPCTMEPKDGDWKSIDDNNWEYRKDVDGKYSPCCEWEKIK